MQVTVLIMEQVRTFTVMMAAGVFVESLWQIRSLFLQRLRRAGRDGWQLRQSHRAGGDSWQLRQSHPAEGGGWQSAHPLARAMVEILFWSVTTLIISMFLYYCAWGKLSVHAGLGFFTGLLLWKKMCCAIIKTWEKTDEAKNLKITARSSTWRKPAPAGSNKRRAEKEKKEEKELRAKQQNTRGKRAIRRSKTRRKIITGITIAIIVLLVFLLVFNIISLKKEQYDTKKEQQALKQQKAELQKELENAETPENIEAQARQQLRLIKPGEVLYMFPSEITDRDDSSTGGQKGDSSQ